MEKNKLIIIALIIIIIVLLVGVFAVMPNMNKQDTNLTFENQSTLNEGDSLKINLTDANGTAISNQTVNITITDDESNSTYSVVTNGNGTGTLKLDKTAGNYTVTATYGGNDKYKESNATKKITIKKLVESKSLQQGNGATASNDDSNYYNGHPRSYFSPGEQAAIDDARAHGYSSPAAYYKATGKSAGQ